METTVPSPCVQACALDESDICTGCGRSLREIGDWLYATGPEKAAIVERAARRRRTGNMQKQKRHA